MANNTPKEEVEQMLLAEHLDALGLVWCHASNGGARKSKCVLIFNHCKVFVENDVFNYNGTAIELKRQKGGRTRPEQYRWLEWLRERGWLAEICKGFDEAKAFLDTVEFRK